MRRVHWGLWMGVLAVAADQYGCAQLSPISRGTCGNGIVEPEIGEDCDTYPRGSCRAQGTVGQCRFGCDAAGQGALCPSGWGCGDDGICRLASSHFRANGHPTQGRLHAVYLGDFDGDKYQDVLTVGDQDVVLRYYDDADPFARFTSARPVSRPSVGMLTTGDATADFTLPNNGGLDVMRGRVDRTVVPTPYSSVKILDNPGDYRLIPVNALPFDIPGLRFSGDRILLFVGDTVQNVDGSSDLQNAVLFQTGRPVNDLVGEVSVGNLDEDPTRSPCEEMVAAYKNSSQVLVLTPCVRMQGGYGWNHDGQALPAVALADGATAGSGASLVDLNRDGHLDIMIAGSEGSLHAAFGTGDGHFHSDPTGISGPADQTAKALGANGESGGRGLPIAVGHLNSDAMPDFVVGAWRASAIYVSNPASPTGYEVSTWRSDTTWTEAKIVDLNGNGIMDVVAASQDALDLDFYNGAGDGLFNHFRIPTTGIPHHVQAGDFDGDLINDLMFAERMGPKSDFLSLLFGLPFGAPSQLVRVGDMGTIREILPADLSYIYGSSDATTDAIVIARAQTAAGDNVSLFSGSTDRQPRSPLWLTSSETTASGTVGVLSAVVGQFDDDPDRHADIAITSFSRDALSDSNNGPGSSARRLWLAPSLGEALLDLGTTRPSDPIPENFGVEYGLLAPIDLDGDGLDEVVLLGSLGSETPSLTPDGGILVARTEVDTAAIKGGELVKPRKWVFVGEPQPTKETYRSTSEALLLGSSGSSTGDTTTEVGTASLDLSMTSQVRVVDIDGDGRLDLAATGVVWQDTGLRMVIALYKNLGNGTLKAQDRFVLPDMDLGPQLAAGESSLGFVFVQADADAPRELVVLTAQGAWMVEVDLANKTVSSPERLQGVSGGRDGVAADFDRDGVEDLAVVGKGGLDLYTGMAVRP